MPKWFHILLIGSASFVAVVVVVVGGIVAWNIYAFSQLPTMTGEEAEAPQPMQNQSADADHGIGRAMAKPQAKALMTDDWFWDITDDDAPFGNDDGAEAAGFFRQWRAAHPKAAPIDGGRQVCERLEQSLDDWKSVTHKDIESDFLPLGTNFSSTHPTDQMVIAIALAQLVVDGYIDPQLRELGLQAVHNEQLPTMIDRYLETIRAERQQRLARIAKVLEQAPSQ